MFLDSLLYVHIGCTSSLEKPHVARVLTSFRSQFWHAAHNLKYDTVTYPLSPEVMSITALPIYAITDPAKTCITLSVPDMYSVMNKPPILILPDFQK